MYWNEADRQRQQQDQTRRPRADMPRYPAKFVSDQELADIHAWLSTMKPGPKAAAIPLLRDH